MAFRERVRREEKKQTSIDWMPPVCDWARDQTRNPLAKGNAPTS